MHLTCKNIFRLLSYWIRTCSYTTCVGTGTCFSLQVCSSFSTSSASPTVDSKVGNKRRERKDNERCSNTVMKEKRRKKETYPGFQDLCLQAVFSLMPPRVAAIVISTAGAVSLQLPDNILFLALLVHFHHTFLQLQNPVVSPWNLRGKAPVTSRSFVKI